MNSTCWWFCSGCLHQRFSSPSRKKLSTSEKLLPPYTSECCVLVLDTSLYYAEDNMENFL